MNTDANFDGSNEDRPRLLASMEFLSQISPELITFK